MWPFQFHLFWDSAWANARLVLKHEALYVDFGWFMSNSLLSILFQAIASMVENHVCIQVFSFILAKLWDMSWRKWKLWAPQCLTIVDYVFLCHAKKPWRTQGNSYILCRVATESVSLCSQLLIAGPVALGWQDIEMFVTSSPACKEWKAISEEDVVAPDTKKTVQKWTMLCPAFYWFRSYHAGHRVGGRTVAGYGGRAQLELHREMQW